VRLSTLDPRDKLDGARSHKRLLSVVAVVALALVACQSTTTSTKVKGGVALWADPPATTPNYIFTMEAPQFNSDIWGQFDEVMYLGLYSFIDNKGNPIVNYSRSVADAPTFSADGLTVTVTLKNWVWSDGTPITSRDLEMWMNLFDANKTSYGGYVPGQIPDNVQSVTYPNAHQAVFTFKQKYNQTWLIYNQLGQLGLMPQHVWDKTSASSPVGDYDETPSGAVQVWTFLNAQSQVEATFDTNPLWAVVDGPFRLEPGDGFDPSTGLAIMIPNPKYSGPDKPQLAKWEMVPYTSDTAEFNALRSGDVDYGYVPIQDISQLGYLKSHGYSIQPWYTFSNNYFVINFTNPKTGPVFKQLYIRQALQRLIDQPEYIKDILKGYGIPTYGPVPVTAGNYVSAQEKQNPYPYSPTAATDLLQSHGWTLHPNGVSVCSDPGTGADQCGAGIPAGTPLEFKMLYASGILVANQEMEAFQSEASTVGIKIDLSEAPLDDTFAASVPCSPSTGNGCNWDLVYWGGPGWTYGLTDTYPEQGQIFLTGAGGNAGGYSDPTNDSLILGSWTGGVSALQASDNYLEQQLPVIYMPLAPYQISAISTKLHGTNQGAGQVLDPQTWYLTN
jgi:peptide/nickel transport system substrate-binding protein